MRHSPMKYTPKCSPTCYLASSRQTFKLDTLPEMFSKLANAPRRPDRQSDELYWQQRKSEEAGPAHLRVGRQNVDRVGCFQVHGTRKGCIRIMRGVFWVHEVNGELRCMYDETLKRLPGIRQSSHLSDPATSLLVKASRRHDVLSALRTIRCLLFCPRPLLGLSNIVTSKNLKPKGC
jgi:hypothetical protein